jgi:hypothetical protein
MIDDPTFNDRAGEPDPGNLFDKTNEDFNTAIIYHRALDGGPHVTPEDLARLEADRLPPEAWQGGEW